MTTNVPEPVARARQALVDLLNPQTDAERELMRQVLPALNAASCSARKKAGSPW